MKDSFNKTVYEIVAKIPAGKVATYGQIAMMAGSPRASRIVGAVMARAEGLALPCHRVIYSDGSLCKGEEFGGANEQRKMLEDEGVVFKADGKVDLKVSLWQGE